MDIWARAADRFVDDHYQSLRGRVRTRIIDAHLGEILPGPPAHVIDVGGGAGNQSLPLSRRGYNVTIIDPSPAMLSKARTALEEESEEVRSRVDLIQSTGEEALEHFDPASFDAVLCHAVLPYLEDPEPLVAVLCELATSKGVVSVVAKNRDTLAMAPGLDARWDEALVAFDAGREVNKLGLDTRADTPADIQRMLQENAVEPLGWFGVRLFTDMIAEDIDIGDDEQVVAVELEASRRDPYRQLSRLFHVLGRKLPDSSHPSVA